MAKCSNKCAHYEMCKWRDDIQEIREQYPFISDIGCGHFAKSASIVTEPEPEPEPEAKPKTETKTKQAEPKPEPKKTQEPAQDLATQGLTYTPQTTQEQPVTNPATELSPELGEIGIDKIYLAEPIVNALKNAGISKVSEIYANKEKLKSILGASDITAIRTKLTSLNMPELKFG